MALRRMCCCSRRLLSPYCSDSKNAREFTAAYVDCIENKQGDIGYGQVPVPRVVLRYKRLSENAERPQKATAYAAGFDLCSAYDCIVLPKEKALCLTDLQFSLPEGCYGRIAGVIDYDYRGNVGVILFNFGTEPFTVNKGDRIAQIICERIYYPEIEEVPNIEDTGRGSGGFGSSGIN